MENEFIGNLHSAPCVATVGPGCRQNSESFTLYRDADTDIISLGHSGFRGGDRGSKILSPIAFLLQAAALALMGHFKSSLLKRPLVRSSSRDQSPSEFWNKVIITYILLILIHMSGYKPLHTVPVSSADQQGQRKVLEPE